MATSTMQNRPAPPPPDPAGGETAAPTADVRAALTEWVLKRGILFILLMTPITALFLGLAGITPVRTGYLTLALAFLALSGWVVWRRSMSTDPTEPVFHVHKFALWALFPYVVFSVVRAPMVWVYDFSYWGPWFEFGSGVTGHPTGTYAALTAGAGLYSLQGFSLSMGFYTLFKRHDLKNAMIYFTVFISSLYSFVFPVLLLNAANPKTSFYIINYWAHFWMGLAAVAAPLVFLKLWPRFKAWAKGSVVVGLVAIWVFPYAFAFGMATFWQFDRQDREELAAFDEITLEVGSTTILAMAGDQARYTVDLQLGPRDFRDYVHWHHAVGAEDIQVQGVLLSNGAPVAWCSGAAGALAVPDAPDPPTYRTQLAALDYTTVPVTCRGPASAAEGVAAGSTVTFEYEAEMMLRLQQNAEPRVFAGTASTVLALG